MAGTKEISNRMKSIRDTMKITNAMYMISSYKMQKAKQDLKDTEPFFFSQQKAVARFMRSLSEGNIDFIRERSEIPDDGKKRGIIVITADKGLAGAYNHNILKSAEGLLKKYKHTRLFVVGELGRQHFIHRDISVDEEFKYTVQNPTLYRAREIAQRMLWLFEEGEIDEVFIIYTRMINAFSMEPMTFRLLPLNREEFDALDEKGYKEEMFFHPSVEAVLKSLVPNVVSGYVYGALVEAYASEHNSRMMAMRAATDSAKDMLRELEIAYNRARQTAITQEVTEVIAGAKAQKSKRG